MRPPQDSWVSKWRTKRKFWCDWVNFSNSESFNLSILGHMKKIWRDKWPENMDGEKILKASGWLKIIYWICLGRDRIWNEEYEKSKVAGPTGVVVEKLKTDEVCLSTLITVFNEVLFKKNQPADWLL